MKKWGIVTIATVIIAVALFAYIKSAKFSEPGPRVSDAAERSIDINGHVLSVEVADTDAAREKGLGDRDSLAENAGMLFVFEKDGMYEFWMKDMHFPIDIIWISSDGHIVDTLQNVSPDSYPTTFSPRSLARYVLELSADAVKRFNIRIGDIVRL